MVKCSMLEGGHEGACDNIRSGERQWKAIGKLGRGVVDKAEGRKGGRRQWGMARKGIRREGK